MLIFCSSIVNHITSDIRELSKLKYTLNTQKNNRHICIHIKAFKISWTVKTWDKLFDKKYKNKKLNDVELHNVWYTKKRGNSIKH